MWFRNELSSLAEVSLYIGEDTVLSSLCFIPLSHRENAGRAPCIPNWTVWTWWFSSNKSYLFANRLADDAQNQSKFYVQSTASGTLNKVFWLRARIEPQWASPLPITTPTELPNCYSSTVELVDENGMYIFVFFGNFTVLPLVTCVKCYILKST